MATRNSPTPSIRTATPDIEAAELETVVVQPAAQDQYAPGQNYVLETGDRLEERNCMGRTGDALCAWVPCRDKAPGTTKTTTLGCDNGFWARCLAATGTFSVLAALGAEQAAFNTAISGLVGLNGAVDPQARAAIAALSAALNQKQTYNQFISPESLAPIDQLFLQLTDVPAATFSTYEGTSVRPNPAAGIGIFWMLMGAYLAAEVAVAGVRCCWQICKASTTPDGKVQLHARRVSPAEAREARRDGAVVIDFSEDGQAHFSSTATERQLTMRKRQTKVAHRHDGTATVYASSQAETVDKFSCMVDQAIAEGNHGRVVDLGTELIAELTTQMKATRVRAVSRRFLHEIEEVQAKVAQAQEALDGATVSSRRYAQSFASSDRGAGLEYDDWSHMQPRPEHAQELQTFAGLRGRERNRTLKGTASAVRASSRFKPPATSSFRTLDLRREDTGFTVVDVDHPPASEEEESPPPSPTVRERSRSE